MNPFNAVTTVQYTSNSTSPGNRFNDMAHMQMMASMEAHKKKLERELKEIEDQEEREKANPQWGRFT